MERQVWVKKREEEEFKNEPANENEEDRTKNEMRER